MNKILASLIVTAFMAGIVTPAHAQPSTYNHVNGVASMWMTDGTCPQDAYIPFEEPHQNIAGTGVGMFGEFTVSADICISSDGGALGGNHFTGTLTITMWGWLTTRGPITGKITNGGADTFYMTTMTRRPLIFEGCFPPAWGTLSNAILTYNVNTTVTCSSP